MMPRRPLFRFALALAAALAAGSGRAQEARPVLGDVISVQNVRLAKPEEFLTAGGEMRVAADMLVVTVELQVITPFLPRALAPPSVVSGDVLGKLLVDPALAGQLVVAVPLPGDGSSLSLALVDHALEPADRDDGKSGPRLSADAVRRAAERIAVPYRRITPVEIEDFETMRQRFVTSQGRLEP